MEIVFSVICNFTCHFSSNDKHLTYFTEMFPVTHLIKDRLISLAMKSVT